MKLEWRDTKHVMFLDGRFAGQIERYSPDGRWFAYHQPPTEWAHKWLGDFATSEAAQSALESAVREAVDG